MVLAHSAPYNFENFLSRFDAIPKNDLNFHRCTYVGTASNQSAIIAVALPCLWKFKMTVFA